MISDVTGIGRGVPEVFQWAMCIRNRSKRYNDMRIDPGQPRSKSWHEFATQSFDLVITVCDQAAGESCPLFPGNPKKLHWSTPDPAKVTGSEAEKDAAFAQAFFMLKDHIEDVQDTQKLLKDVVSRLGLEPRALALKGERLVSLNPTVPILSHSSADQSSPGVGLIRGHSGTVHGQNTDNDQWDPSNS